MAAGSPCRLGEHGGPGGRQDRSQEYVVPIRDPNSIAERLREQFEHPERQWTTPRGQAQEPEELFGTRTVGIAEAPGSA